MKYWLILFAFIIAAPAYSIEKSSPEKNSTAECVDKLSPFEWRNHLDEIEQQLASARDAKIKTIIPMKDYLQSLGHKPSGTTDCFFIEFADGMQAVWKPEDHVWGSHGEVAAFHAARLIGMRNVPEDQAHPFLFAEGPRILFPFARRIIADAVRDAGYPPLMLEPIDFNGLYMQQLAQAQATAEAVPAGNA